MLKANISKENKQQTVQAAGSIPEVMNDVAVLLSSIYNQFNAISPAAAKLFRKGMENMLRDPKGEVWKAAGNQTGVIFRRPDEEE